VTDFRYAFRSLAKDIRVTAAAIITLALGIGFSTLMFSIFYNIVVSPLPYQFANRLVTIRHSQHFYCGFGDGP
jgi:ATP/ADP translocase